MLAVLPILWRDLENRERAPAGRTATTSAIPGLNSLLKVVPDQFSPCLQPTDCS
jgi:hypothetical protein